MNLNESQNIEFKQTWRDEYIKWLSAFQEQNIIQRIGSAKGGIWKVLI